VADPSPLCALAYASFLSFMTHHGDPTTYAQSYDFAMFIANEATDIANRLEPCEGRSAELALITRIARQAVALAHALEDRPQGAQRPP
jgi:hypothetical protein